VNEKYLAIVNPAAGGGRSAKLAGEELARLKAKGLRIDVIASTGPGHVAELAGAGAREVKQIVHDLGSAERLSRDLLQQSRFLRIALQLLGQHLRVG